MNSVRKEIRCAVYTRKSTEHNLDLEFNSLDAQREACEAYIKSQIHEGWRLIEDHYDDGGLSGATLDRAGLKQLLSDISTGKIDTVVVYKVDRLTRSLTDFAKLVELFDAHNVSFVSVTQAFNTTNSMGRLTLNVLLSFAQFEREVIGERVRDKVAASKRKGLYMGGLPAVGYVNREKKLEVVPEEAETVRFIFNQFLELGSVGLLLKELNARGIKTKARTYNSGRKCGGGPFWKGALIYLLKNRCYVGEIAHRGEIHTGDHQAIVDRKIFDAVQAALDDRKIERRLKAKASPYLLTGKIFDSVGNAMSPTHTNKKGVRYRYYVSQGILQRRDGISKGEVSRISAPDIEALVTKVLEEKFGDPMATTLGQPRELLESKVEQITIRKDAMELKLRDGTSGANTISTAWAGRAINTEKGLVRDGICEPENYDRARVVLLTAIARARRWVKELADGANLADIATREDKSQRQIRLLLPLAFVSPDLVQDVVVAAGPIPTVTKICRNIPLLWTGIERRPVQFA